MLNRYLEEEIEAELDRIGARSTSYWMPNITTPNDVLLVLKAIADPSYTSPELSAEMLDVMTGTAFEDRLPRPLPDGARVAHKIGSYESTFSDAGIVLSAERSGVGKEYYIVVFSEGAPEGGPDKRSGRSRSQLTGLWLPPRFDEGTFIAAIMASRDISSSVGAGNTSGTVP